MTEGRPNDSSVGRALRGPRLLVGGYLAISLLALATIVLFRHSAGMTTPVWVHGILVTASALLTNAFAAQTVRGSKGAFLRLRIASALMLVPITVILAIPGSFPLWMKLEQGVCGVLLLRVVVIVNSRRVHSAFPAR